MFSSFRSSAEAARRHPDLFFAGLLTDQDIDSAMGESTALLRRWIYTPLITITVFLTQCMSADHSCREAVAKLLAWRMKRGLKPCSADTGTYCDARDELPEAACQQLATNVGRQLDESAPSKWLWCKRRVCVVDGSTITMADTPDNQAEYPQLRSQKPGCGFPIARLVVVFSLSVGSVIQMAIGKFKGKLTGENSMFRQMHKHFTKGDVILSDRSYAGWFDIALAIQAGLDVVTRLHQARRFDFRTGTRLGKDDHIISAPKPARPTWMDEATYQSLPEEIQLRQCRIRVTKKGFRTKKILLETTLLDATTYSLEDLARLYRRRWDAEIGLRNLKITMQMDHLRCKTPHRVHNEFYMHVLAHNLIRKTIAIAAMEAGVQPYQISFKGALQTLLNFLAFLSSDTDIDQWCRQLIAAIATHEIANRPDRYEPRVRKRRPKQYKLMNRPRSDYKKSIQ